MYPERLQKIHFHCSGSSVEAILDRLPTVKVRSSDEQGSIIEAEV